VQKSKDPAAGKAEVVRATTTKRSSTFFEKKSKNSTTYIYMVYSMHPSL